MDDVEWEAAEEYAREQVAKARVQWEKERKPVGEYANPRKHIGPFKAYLVTVYTTGFNVPIDMLVLGCASSRSAILTALQDCCNETRALGVKQVIPYDNLVDRCE
jgi:hypothetical protein